MAESDSDIGQEIVDQPEPTAAVHSTDDGSAATTATDFQPVTNEAVLEEEEEDDEEYTPTLYPFNPENDVADNAKNDPQPVKQASPPPAADSLVSTHEMLSNPVKTDDSPSVSANDPAISSTAPPAQPPVPDPKISSLKSPSQPSTHLPLSVNVSSSSTTSSSPLNTVPKTRLPNDRVGILEDRIKEDPRGDIDAWLSLIDEHKKRNKLEEARATYERFFKVFPTAAEQWVSYANMELDSNEFYRVEQIFNKSLLNAPNVQLWSAYLNYVRRRNNLTTDNSGEARRIITEAYEFVLSTIGIDKDSGHLWQDYIQFVRSSPEQLGGTSWQDQQKMDTLRKIYQRAVCIPTQAVPALWKEYDTFERSFNKQTGRKLIQEKSSAYITARSAHTALHNLTEHLNRNALPRMPPAPGCDGDTEYASQIDIWRSWIKWEKDDPLVMQHEDPTSYRQRILYVYKQAVMPLRFWPEMWFDAAEFCFANALEKDGNEFLSQGIAANPESCLLAFKRADRIEATTSAEESAAAASQRGVAVREPYDKLLSALYELLEKTQQREKQALGRIEELFPAQPKDVSKKFSPNGDQDDEDAAGHVHESDASRNAKAAQLEAVRAGFAPQIKQLSQTVSAVWIALMRAMARVQGKGKVSEAVGGSRQVFTDARKKGGVTMDLFIESALLEHYRYKDPAANKIFERGVRLYQKDEHLALAFIKYLINSNDVTNARSVFETTVTRLTSDPETKHKAKILFQYLHEFESKYGELSQIKKLEDRMQELFPENSELQQFSSRFTENDFNPTSVRLIISPATQTQPKSLGHPSAPNLSSQNSPRPSIPSTTPQIPQAGLSPKRQFDESDAEASLSRKIPRSDSPLKGAAGRRLDAQKRSQLRNQTSANGSHSNTPSMSAPPPLPPPISRLLTMLPRPDLYPSSTTRFNPDRIVDLVRNVDLTKANPPRPTPQPQPQLQHPPVPQNYAPQSYGYPPQNANYGYPRQ